MNPKQRRNVIILAVLGVVILIVAYFQVFKKTDFQKQYEANLAAKTTQTPVAGQTSTPPAAASDAVPAAAAAAAPATQASTFQKADVNIDELIAGIKEVDFDYDQVAMDKNPMTPLVGPFAPQRIAATGEEGSGKTAPMRQDIQALVRNLQVTGIMWDKYDPMAVIRFPVQGESISEVVTRGFEFPDMGVTVHNIEKDRVILNINGVEVPIELEER